MVIIFYNKKGKQYLNFINILYNNFQKLFKFNAVAMINSLNIFKDE